MSFIDRHNNVLVRIGWILCGYAVLAGIFLSFSFQKIPSDSIASGMTDPAVLPSWPKQADAGVSTRWSVFQGSNDIVPSKTGELAKRFRLAGTFFEYITGDAKSDTRRAILDDLRNKTQYITKEQDKIDDVTIVSILRDRVILRDLSGEEELWLSFAKSGASGAKPGEGEGNTPESAISDITAQFGGKQIGKNRWVFKRKALLDYYSGLRDEPKRLLHVFDSLKPARDKNNKINGYILDITGEADFFHAVGLKEGDIIRSANSMRMKNRNRAEYLINEFIADRANAFVLDVQRNGKKEKLIYQIR